MEVLQHAYSAPAINTLPVCVFMCVCVCLFVSVCVCARAHVYAYSCGFACSSESVYFRVTAQRKRREALGSGAQRPPPKTALAPYR